MVWLQGCGRDNAGEAWNEQLGAGHMSLCRSRKDSGFYQNTRPGSLPDPPFSRKCKFVFNRGPKKKRSSLPSRPAPAHSSVISDPHPAQHSILKKSTGRVCPGTGSSHGEPRHPQKQDEVISKNPFVLN